MAWFQARQPRIGSAHYALYGAIVAQSRQKIFYEEIGVPDSVTGRFDMISLHMALVLKRLQKEGPDCVTFAQGLFDLFFKDMDRSLREMGVTDIGVPKRIEKMGELFYGLVEGLGRAQDNGSEKALADFAARNLLPEDKADSATRLAGYIRVQTNELAGKSVDDLMAGRLEWNNMA